MRLTEFIRRYFVVRKCGGCGEILDFEHSDSALCDKCSRKLSVAMAQSCPTCFQSAIECSCMPKGMVASGALCLRKLYFYSAQKAHEPQNRLIYYLKKNPNRRIFAFIGGELYRLLSAELSVIGDSEAVITYIPRTARARRIYGFDQSLLMARQLSAISGIPFASLLRRRRGDREQKRLDRSRRFRNVEGRFSIIDPQPVKGKYVVLIDDVVTTGASMAACTKILMKNGALGVICLCIATD